MGMIRVLPDGSDAHLNLALTHADSALGRALTGSLAAKGVGVLALESGNRAPLGESEVDALMAELKAFKHEKGSLDGFVYLLPSLWTDSVLDLDMEGWRLGMAQLREAFFFYRRAVKLLAAQRHGSIIGVAFGIGARGDEAQLTWSAVGEALTGMAKCLTQEVAKQEIRVNTVYYGLIAEADYPHEVRSALEKFTKLLDIPRAGRAEDLAAWIHLLASEEGSFVNGQVAFINGGLL